MAVPSERIAMPFACGFDNGRLTLSPSAEKSYSITGARDQQPFTVCAGAADASCRTFMIHRFAISCVGVRVPWVRVIAAVQRTAAGRVWLEQGRLNVERPVPPNDGEAQACDDRRRSEAPSYIGGPRPSPIPPECLPWKPQRQVEKMRFPEGFAPVGELGARFIFEGTPGGHAETGLQLAANGAIATGAVAGGQGGRGTGIAREPLPSIAGAMEEPDPALSWTTVVEARDLTETPILEGSSTGSTGLMLTMLALVGMTMLGAGLLRKEVPAGLAGLMSFAGLASIAGLVRAQAATAPRDQETPAEDRQSAAPLAEIAEEAGAHLAQAEKAVLSLRQAEALRDVLEDELHVMSRRLAVLRATSLDPRAAPAKLLAQFRSLVRDLERVKRIAAGAAASLAGGLRASGKMPETEAEAYDALGVNPEVTSTTLKKLVDALRMTWHPDHAKDEADRCLREGRIKEINIAWDIISARRQAA